MSIQNKPEKKEVNPLVAGVTGAIFGGAAVATAMTLSDQKRREEIKEKLTDVQDKARGYVEEVRGKVQDKQDEIKEKILDTKKKAKNAANIVEGSIHRTAKDIKKEYKK